MVCESLSGGLYEEGRISAESESSMGWIDVNGPPSLRISTREEDIVREVSIDPV